MAQQLKEGMREDEIPAIIEPVYLKQGGYAGIHFMSSMPMRHPDFPVPSQFQSSRKLQKGDCLITEISGAYSGYSGQIHRTFPSAKGRRRNGSVCMTPPSKASKLWRGD